MASLLYRIGSFSFRRWPVVVAAWLVAIIAAGVLAGSVAKPFVNSFSIPGIDSLETQTTQQELFPGTPDAQDQATANVVVEAPEGRTLRDPEVAAQVDALVAQLRELPQLPDDVPIANPAQTAQAQFRAAVQGATEAGQPRQVAEANARELLPLSEDGRVGVITWDFDVASPADVEQSTRDQLLDDLEQARDGGLSAEVNGTGMQAVPSVGGPAEATGIAVAAVVLVITFGSLVAAGLPILVGLIGVGLGVTGILATTALVDMNSTTLILAVMIGLAVGIDYTLFILSRYRAELRRTGATTAEERRHAAARAVGTAGSAVVFAGLTVIIALGFLVIAGVPFLTTMGLAAAGTVLVAVLVALTLLPAVLGLLGRRAFGGQVRTREDKVDDQGLADNNGTRWARLVGRRPWAVVLVVVVALGALALPARAVQLTLPVDATAASDTTQRKASDIIGEAFGPGREAPLVVVVDSRDLPAQPQQRQLALGGVVQWASGLDDVRNAQVVQVNDDLSGAVVLVTPRSGPSSQATLDLLQTLRDDQRGVEQQTGTTLGVTGQTAIQTDVSDRLGEALPIYLAVVVGLAFLLLMLVFRSLLVPVTATLGFLLSVLATLGATVAIFQEGTFGLVEGQPLVSFAPIVVIGIVFGLAMDYQVFLVSRMREAHVHGMSAREAVVDGFRNSARVVTAAATIMISVFGAFILEHDPLIQSIGFALAAAVFLDAFVVRMALVPALMYLLGERAWWLPRWLDRLLPELDVEGEKLAVDPPRTERPGKHRAEPVRA
ncbi:MMPL family transporter [Nocardioides marmoraquaticus]